MAREGIPFIILFLIPAVIFVAFGWWIAAALCLLLAGFMAFFFRDPVRGQTITIVCRQIAGGLARRIVLWKKKGERVQLGARIGLMKFSSRMDVIIPAGVEVLVGKGDRVVGGVTILGRLRNT